MPEREERAGEIAAALLSACVPDDAGEMFDLEAHAVILELHANPALLYEVLWKMAAFGAVAAIHLATNLDEDEEAANHGQLKLTVRAAIVELITSFDGS
jgi:hypothetical protein